MAIDIRTCAGLANFNTGNSKCQLDPGKVKAIILTVHGYKLPTSVTAETLEAACHADRPARLFPIKTVAEFEASGGEAETSTLGYGPTKVTGYSAFSATWTVEEYDGSLKANIMRIKNTAMDAYFVDENNVVFGMSDDTDYLAGIPLSGVYPGGQDWDSSGTEANLTITTMFKDYEKYIKNADTRSYDFDVTDALSGLVYVDFVSTDGGYKVVEHYGHLDVTEYFGQLLADNSDNALPNATAVSYDSSTNVLTITGDTTLASPSVLQQAGIIGIEQWS